MIDTFYKMDIDLLKINLFSIFAIGITLMEVNAIIVALVGVSAIALNMIKIYKTYKDIDNRDN